MKVLQPTPVPEVSGAIDFDHFRLPAEPALPDPPRPTARSTPRNPTREVITGEFLAAIPMKWLERAARLPGSALAVALLIRHLYKMRGPDPVVLSNIQADRFGVSASAKRRALTELEEAGLIGIVEQLPGRAPLVVPLDAE